MEVLTSNRRFRGLCIAAAVLVLSTVAGCGKRTSAPAEAPKAAPAPYVVSAKAFASDRDGVVAAPQPVAPASVERIDHGRMKDLVIYRPPGEPRTVVLFLSGDHGWVRTADGGVPAMAERLAAQGALVVGISTPDLIASFEANPTPCVYPDGDMVNLSHFVQAYYKMPTYHAPVLIGYSSGASFAYAILAQMNVDTFAGLMTLGFGPQLPMKKPMCPGTGFAGEPHGDGVEMKPSAKIGDPWIALAGEEDKATPVAVTQAFAAKVPGASVVTLPKTGHDFAMPASWQAAFDAAYAKLADQDKPRALPPPPASLNGLPVVEVPPKDGVAEGDTFAILISGDGGWAGIDEDVAAALGRKGVRVVGVDSLRYFWDKRTPDSLAADLDRIIGYYMKSLGKTRVMLIGYSQGADVMPFALNRLPQATRDQVSLVALMGLSVKAAFEFHMSNWVSSVDDGLPTQPEMEKLPAAPPVLCLYGMDDAESLCPKLDAQRFKLVKLPGGHHFGGDYDRLADEILGAAKH